MDDSHNSPQQSANASVPGVTDAEGGVADPDLFFRDGAVRLRREVDQALDSNRWVILNSRRTWKLLYEAAALRHCCALLMEIEIAAATHSEFFVRMLGRAHIETWFTALYIHFGGEEALTEIIAGSLDQTQALHQAFKTSDERLKMKRDKARRRQKAIREANEHLKRWNADHPHQPPKPLHEELYIPQLPLVSSDLTGRLSDFAGFDPQSLPVADIVEKLTQMGPVKGFSKESFDRTYLFYRLLSVVGVHPTLHVLDTYFRGGDFMRTADKPLAASLAETVRSTALYSTAYLARWILGDRGTPTPVADELTSMLELPPQGHRGWTPGLADAD